MSRHGVGKIKLITASISLCLIYVSRDYGRMNEPALPPEIMEASLVRFIPDFISAFPGAGFNIPFLRSMTYDPFLLARDDAAGLTSGYYWHSHVLWADVSIDSSYRCIVTESDHCFMLRTIVWHELLHALCGLEHTGPEGTLRYYQVPWIRSESQWEETVKKTQEISECK